MAKENVGEVILKNVRLSFLSVFEPGDPMKDDDGNMQPGKYKANILLEDKQSAKTKADFATIRAVCQKVKEATWGADPKLQPKLRPEQVCMRDGDLENWDGYENAWYISANNANQPVLVDRIKDADGKWVELTKENGGPKKIYSGAYGNVVIRIWGQKSKKLPSGKTIPNRLNASIESIQHYRHGDPFSGAKPVDPNEKFADVDEIDDGTFGESSASNEVDLDDLI